MDKETLAHKVIDRHYDWTKPIEIQEYKVIDDNGKSHNIQPDSKRIEDGGEVQELLLHPTETCPILKSIRNPKKKRL